MEVIDLCSDDDLGEVDTGFINMQPRPVNILTDKELTTSTSCSTGQSGTCVMEKRKQTVDESTTTSPCSRPTEHGAPICRQFWKAGIYNADVASVSKPHVGSTCLNIHPKFLHSNATSHKWAFGAIAELVDNAVDEIKNNATFVVIDKTKNPRNGSPALLIQDDGSGMGPEALRKCLSFGFSDKSRSSIGKYGNGLKTSSMRLGADAIVFTRTVVDQTLTQSIGLLSYTFLTRLGYDRIVVPMVHYKFNSVTHSYESLHSESDSQPNLNLSMLLQWSPYSTEEQLLNQFNDVGNHGTKIIVYNLWLNDDGNIELDFKSDTQDIRLSLVEKTEAKDGSQQATTDNHVANRLKYSLRAYLSILYLKLPPSFRIQLRGKVVLYHNITTDLKHPEFILYKPHKGGSEGASVITTIGFLKEAPRVSVHGFSIYHKGRLILPFLPVTNASNGKGRGVVGVLEANFIEPTHNKQDFEKTNVFQKLVTRLRDMTYEYWDLHCEILGYTVPAKAKRLFASGSGCKEGKKSTTTTTTTTTPASATATTTTTATKERKLPEQHEATPSDNLTTMTSVNRSNTKRKLSEQPEDMPSDSLPMMTCVNRSNTKMKSPKDSPSQNAPVSTSVANTDQRMTKVLKENQKLRQRCLDLERSVNEVSDKVLKLKSVLEEAKREYGVLLDKMLEN